MNATYKVLSEIFRDIAQVVFGAAVVAKLIGAPELNLKMVVGGMGFSLVFWWFAVKMGQKGKV